MFQTNSPGKAGFRQLWNTGRVPQGPGTPLAERPCWAEPGKKIRQLPLAPTTFFLASFRDGLVRLVAHISRQGLTKYPIRRTRSGIRRDRCGTALRIVPGIVLALSSFGLSLSGIIRGSGHCMPRDETVAAEPRESLLYQEKTVRCFKQKTTGFSIGCLYRSSKNVLGFKSINHPKKTVALQPKHFSRSFSYLQLCFSR